MLRRSSRQRREGVATNWLELPRDVTAKILRHVGAVDVLTRAQYVCTAWRRISRHPSMWRHIDILLPVESDYPNHVLERVCRLAVNLSRGSLISISIQDFATDDLLDYIANRSRQLKYLQLVWCYSISDEALALVATRLPLLEELEFSHCTVYNEETIKAFGRCCPLLKSFKLNFRGSRSRSLRGDEEARAVAENMHGLVHLQIIGNRLTNAGLKAILDSCNHLQSLDLRRCWHLCLAGQLEKICSRRIEVLRRPYDSTDDFPYDYQNKDGDEDSDLSGYDEYDGDDDYDDYDD